MERYYRYNTYLKKRYGKPAYRIGVDGGFSCPNRDQNRKGGCTFCDDQGSLAVYQPPKTETKVDINSAADSHNIKNRLSLITKQINEGRLFLQKRYGAELFLLYFQAFSGTYGTTDELKMVYDHALAVAEFKELIVSTRPDCITPEKAALLAQYKLQGLDVWVELGLQSVNDSTLRRINRGHTSDDFFSAFNICRSLGLKIAVHLVFGLPGENWSEIERSVKQVAALKPNGIKIHNLHIPRGCHLFHEYLCGELTVSCSQRHLDYTVQALELLPSDTIIMRVTCDTPKLRLAAPLKFGSKAQFYQKLKKELKVRNTLQGQLN